MNANLTGSPSRRRPSLFLGCCAPSATSALRAAGAPVPPPLPSSALPAASAGIDVGLPHPISQRSFREIQLPRQCPDGLPTVPDEPHRLCLELLRERPPRALGHDTLLPHFRAIGGVHRTGAGSGDRRMSAGGCAQDDAWPAASRA